jgi:mRNA interferase HigB
MQIVFLTKLIEFCQTHANARVRLSSWKIVTENAIWKSKKNVLHDFPKAKMLRNNRARFEILHNTFRLIVHIRYEDQIVEIRFIGTHNDYDKIDSETV